MPHEARAIIELARQENRDLQTVARSHTEAERSYLERHGVGLALVGEHELALGLAHHSLLMMGCDEDAADATVLARRRRARSSRPGPAPRDPTPA